MYFITFLKSIFKKLLQIYLVLKVSGKIFSNQVEMNIFHDLRVYLKCLFSVEDISEMSAITSLY